MGLLTVIGAVIVLGLGAYALRSYNLHRYSSPNGGPEEYLHPTDLRSYPTEIPGITVEHVQGQYLNGFHLKPETVRHQGSVVTFGGSDGSPNFHEAQALAEQGYDTWALFFFGMPNQSPELARVPLDFFSEALDRIHAEGTPGPLTVLGASKGAELSAELASTYPQDIDNIVLLAPSAYSYQGLTSDFEDVPSWTFRGEDVPWISLRDASPGRAITMSTRLGLGFPTSYRDVYTSATERSSRADDARIPIERFPGRVLAFAGTEDRMWDSGGSASLIADHHPNTTVSIQQGAGHVYAPMTTITHGGAVINLGGDVESNTRAEEEYRRVLTETLATWHPSLEETPHGSQ